MYSTDVTYMNQNMKMARATPNAASAMMKKVTPPAMAPALPLPSGFSRLPGGLVIKGEILGIMVVM